MIFDGDCRFCTRWIHRWNQSTGDRVEYCPSQDSRVQEKFPELPSYIFNESVQFIETNGEVFSGAEAVFRSLAYSPKKWPLRLYQKSSLFAALTEAAYRLVARNRTFFSWLTRLVLGKEESPAKK